MKSIIFQIFVPKKKLIFSTNLFIPTIYSSVIITGLIMTHYFKSFYDLFNIHNYIMYVVYFITAFSIVMYFLKFPLTRTLNGQFIGELELSADKIRITENIFPLGEINSIDFDVKDFEGDVNLLERGFNPMQSRGVDNALTIDLNSGASIKVYFLQRNEDELLRNRELLIFISYFEKGKIPFMKLMKLLKIESYSDIQAFKAKHNH